MTRSRRPEVKPIRRYKAPAYPASDEPNPVEHPSPVPYPFSKKLVGAIAGLGLAAGGLAQDDAKKATGNPFKLANSGLPFQSSMYGTGQPSRVTEGMARSVIEKVFKELGYDLERDHAIEAADVGFVANGYDGKRKVGYVFADGANLDDTAILGVFRSSKGEDKKAAETRWLKAMSYRLKGDDQALAKRILETPPGNDHDRRLAELKRRYRAKHLSLDEVKRLEGPRKDRRFIAVISQFDQRLEYRPRFDNDDYRLAAKIKDPKKRQEAYEKVFATFAKKNLEQLEKSVREYLVWARANGAH